MRGLLLLVVTLLLLAVAGQWLKSTASQGEEGQSTHRVIEATSASASASSSATAHVGRGEAQAAQPIAADVPIDSGRLSVAAGLVADYAALHESALAGDAAAMFDLYELLSRCAMTPTQEALSQHQARGQLSQEQVRQLRLGAQACTPLRNHLAPARLDEQARYWLSAAAGQQQPTARYIDAMWSGQNISKQADLLRLALQQDARRAAPQVAHFFGNPALGVDAADRDAWWVLYCRQQLGCTEAQVMDELAASWSWASTTQILAAADRLQDALAEGKSPYIAEQFWRHYQTPQSGD